MQKSVTQHELHLHLHGCLDAEDVWELGRVRWESRRGALQWYAAEYELAWGRSPLWESYWTHPDGLELLRRDYVFKQCGTFDRFQACFNLLIALFPITANDDTVIRCVLAKLQACHLRHVELRMPFGLSLAHDRDAILRFLSMLTTCARNYESSTFTPRFAISLPREHDALKFQYEVLRSWLRDHSDLAPAITAIDFCGAEENYPPEHKRDFFAQVHRDNSCYPSTALAILYHVGESFATIGIEKAIEWIRSSHRYGVHRLGHCIALGYSGLLIPNDSAKRIWDLQERTMDELKEKKAIIEVCPSSNRYLGGIVDEAQHPLGRFLNKGMNVALSSDDPGIFATNLQNEETISRELYGMTQEQLLCSAHFAESATAELLSGRV